MQKKLFVIIIAVALGLIIRQYNASPPNHTTISSSNYTGEKSIATFAGGCFWCMQPAFDMLTGVIETTVGYAGGDGSDANYEDVSSGKTKHREAIQVMYDPKQISYTTLLETYRKQIDPTNPDGQFSDIGPQYQTAIYYHDTQQKEEAEQSKKLLSDSQRYDKPIVTDIIAYVSFFPAEEYHQKYYQKSSLHYSLYKKGSGREARVEGQSDISLSKETPSTNGKGGDTVEETIHTFIKPSAEQLKKTLSPLQYRVTQEGGTEEAFNNLYRDNHRQGIYIDIVSGEPLFSSLDKFDSGTGWPSFTKPIAPDAVSTHGDMALVIPRIEVRSRYADSHLGHVFDDGPAPTGSRYCINSASLAFVPIEDMEKRGYDKWLTLFQ